MNHLKIENQSTKSKATSEAIKQFKAETTKKFNAILELFDDELKTILNEPSSYNHCKSDEHIKNTVKLFFDFVEGSEPTAYTAFNLACRLLTSEENTYFLESINPFCDLKEDSTTKIIELQHDVYHLSNLQFDEYGHFSSLLAF